ncbi:GTP cyclohydrolase II [Dactylosporangium sp. CS-047395]|uniref:GTP cyclohydrolase II n=1 Tax=Dactylosporangium sp. CS-047395 TaxID=3239936 RepID=UPI003D94FCA0
MEKVTARLRTREGQWQFSCYPFDHPETPTMALVMGEVVGADDVVVRVQSECLTGHIFGSLSCDCYEQLHHALEQISAAGRGVIVYLRQEGRGIGLMSKVRAYILQQAEGADTVDANLRLGHGIDDRSYEEAVHVLRDLGVASIALLSNNPRKSAELRAGDIAVAREVLLPTFDRPENSRYLQTKRDRLGHRLDVAAPA